MSAAPSLSASAQPPLRPLAQPTQGDKFNPPEIAGKPSLIGLTRDQLTETIAPLKVQKFRQKQLWHWIYHRGATDFDQMTNLSKSLRSDLKQSFSLDRLSIKTADLSNDGTRKWLVSLPDQQDIETVYIPETDRGTLCISSQVGCTLTCKFCHTGTQRLVRNLSAGEIVGQFLLAKDDLDEWPKLAPKSVTGIGEMPPETRLLSNIVMMGMGEPLYNFENVRDALNIIMDPEGLALSRRRITLSTSGVVPMMDRCGHEIGVNLAISLHAVNDDTRDILVPINKKYPIKELLAACKRYPGVNNARRITFEYVMLKEVNDSVADAKELVRLLKGIPAKINLIPFNPWPGSPYERSTNNAINRFAKIVMDAGYASPVRTPRGEDIMAACGQLKSESQRLSAAEKRKQQELAQQMSA